jgi:hypothetical protein
MKVLNAETMRKDLVGKVRNIRIYNGSAEQNRTDKIASVAHSEAVIVKGDKWLNSAGREKLLQDRKLLEGKVNEQRNAATGYDLATLQKLAAIYTIDLVRQSDEYADYTPVLFKEVVDEDAPESVILRDMMPYIGKEGDIIGSGDTVPLMEHALPQDYTVYLKIRGFGDKTTLRQLVFNPFHKTERIIESAARILADEKNNDSLGPIFGASFTSAAHKQAKDTTGSTLDLQLYNTLKKGIRKALELKCKPLEKENGLFRHEIYLLVNPLDLIDIQPIINGALQGVGGIQQIAATLPISGIIPYGGGLNHGLKYGAETLSYPGVPRGKVYAFVKIDSFGGYRIVKRNETMEIGDGDVLGLSAEKRAWHRIRGMFNDFVLPKTVGAENYGAVVEITLPEFT